VNYRPWLEGDALRQMSGLPHDAFDVLAVDRFVDRRFS